MESLEVPNKIMQGGHDLVANFRSQEDNSRGQIEGH